MDEYLKELEKKSLTKQEKQEKKYYTEELQRTEKYF